jgi:protein required for attachment to host cells
VKVDQGDWVVVCDRAKALVLENAGDEMFPNLRTKEVFEQPDLATHEQGTDAPGRSVNSVDARRSAMEQTDWHDLAERDFLTRLIGHLDAAVHAGKPRKLVVVAPPRALGMMRPAYSPALQAAIRAEIDQDYVKMPLHEIEKHLFGK